MSHEGFSTPKSEWHAIVDAEFRAIESTDAVLGVTLLETPEGPVIGFCVAGFVTREFSHEVLNSRLPFTKAMARRFVLEGRSPLFPNPDRDPLPLAQEMGDEGLHLHFFSFAWEGEATGGNSMALRSAIGKAFLEWYGGTYLRLITIEALGEPFIVEAARHGFQPMNEFPDQEPGIVRAVLMGVDRTQADISGNFWHLDMFSRTRPHLPLSHRQRRMLYHLRFKLSDREIAKRVFLSTNSMKTSWDRIYDVVVSQHPEIETTIGTKRQALADFLRDHPQEVWPCEMAKPS